MSQFDQFRGQSTEHSIDQVLRAARRLNQARDKRLSRLEGKIDDLTAEMARSALPTE